MKKAMCILFVLTLCIGIIQKARKALLLRKKTNISFFLMKDTPYYTQVKGEKCGVLQAVVHGERQQVLVAKVIDKKWAQLATGVFVKLSYLQLNVENVTALMANEDVFLYAAPSKKASIVGQLVQGTVVQVDHLTEDRHFARIHTKNGAAYVPFAYMKY